MGTYTAEIRAARSTKKREQLWQELIQERWDEIAAFCQADNQVSLGLVEGLNNKIRVLQRSAYLPRLKLSRLQRTDQIIYL